MWMGRERAAVRVIDLYQTECRNAVECLSDNTHEAIVGFRVALSVYGAPSACELW